jgi:Protein of unknown function (DUF3455)
LIFVMAGTLEVGHGSRVMIRWAATIGISILGLGLGSAAPARATGGDVHPPLTLPAVLRVPAGATPIARFHATGAQVYKCTTTDGKYGWALQRPDATLHDAAGAVVGTHGVGPTWTSKDGSSVVGAKLEQAPAPVAGAVPWLLLRATSTSGAGQFGAVTFVQRVDTKGGTAPGAGCDAPHAGAEARASYSADYYFYAGGAAPKPTQP